MHLIQIPQEEQYFKAYLYFMSQGFRGCSPLRGKESDTETVFWIQRSVYEELGSFGFDCKLLHESDLEKVVAQEDLIYYHAMKQRGIGQPIAEECKY